MATTPVTAPSPSQRRRRGRRLAAALALALVLVAVDTGPASAVDDSFNQYVLDQDPVALSSITQDVQFGDGLFVGTFPDAGTLKWYRSTTTGRIRGQLVGRLGGAASSASCRVLRVTWIYGDASQTRTETPRSCGVGTAPVDMDSAPGRDALKVSIEVYRIEAFLPEDNLDLAASRLEQVSEPGDGNGTCGKVDRDSLTMSNAAGPLFVGTVTYVCDAGGGNDLRARVTGTLYWNNALPGGRAKLRLRSSGSDGTASTAESGIVSPFTPLRSVSLTSPAGSDVLRVRAAVLSAPLISTGVFTERAERSSDLGRG